MKTFTSSVWGMEVVVTTDDNNLITNVTSEGEQMNTGFTNEDGEFECWSEGEFEELVEDLSESYGEEFTFIVGAFKKVFTKRAEVIEHFVANGIHAGIAKALVTEYYDWGNYNSNPEYKEEGLLQQINEDDVCEAATLTEEEADKFFASNGDDFEVGLDDDDNECILFDNEPLFDLLGNHL